MMRRLITASFLAFSFACGDDGAGSMPDGAVGTRTFGQPCTTQSDCVSGLCLATGADTAVCTELCTSDVDCPNGVSWGCISAEGFEPQVCGCVTDADEERCGDSRDNDCDGVTDDCRICDGRFVPDDDPEHCGGCGNACGPGNLCLDAECVCAAVGDTLCDGACVDTAVSPFHCGACGAACEDGRECIDGECGCPESRPDLCEGRGCFDLADDAFNCGACGVRCPLAQQCIDGTCECPADRGSTLCGSECVDVRTSGRHCGECGNVCPLGVSCVDGECDCGFGAEACGSACVDTSTDPANCGACGNACREDQLCESGRCTCGEWTECFGRCVHVLFDADHCGACGVRCPAGGFCDGGGTCSCGGMTDCGGTCRDTTFDPNHCGGCGRVCRPGEACDGGTCTCPSNVVCGGTCLPMDDPANCGACGRTCEGDLECRDGDCRCPVSSSLAACGTECVDLRASTTHCGTCGNTCRPGESCVSGRCRCPSGQVWCESANACVSTSTDTANCGECGNACRATETCSFNTCRCPLSNQAWCDGACIDVASDRDNCGSCGNECAADATCVSRSCRCSVAGQTSCGADGCRDLQTDTRHCGTCGNACAGGQYCASGTCLCPVATPGAAIELGYAFEPTTWDAVWDGEDLTSVHSDFANPLELTWIDATGAGGSRSVPTTIDSGFEDLLRLRITPSSVGWNVLVQTSNRDTGARAHYLVRLASDRSLLGQRRLDSSVASWAEADLTYVPGTGPVLTWITGTPATAFVRVLNEDGTNAGGSVVLGNVSGVPSIAYDGAGELAVTVANGAAVRLRTYFVSTALAVRATHDDVATVAADRAFVQGRSGEWLVAARSGTSVRVLRGARLASAGTRAISNPRAVHWVGDEVAVFSGGVGTLGTPAGAALSFRRYDDDLAFAVDAALTLSSWDYALGVARVSPTRAVVLGMNPSFPGTFGAVLDLGDCPR